MRLVESRSTLSPNLLKVLILALSCNHSLGQATTPPRIFNQPQSEVINLGGRVSFSTDLNLFSRFQWYHNEEPLSFGTNRSVTLTNLTFADSGNYRVAISNNIGSVTSNPAILTVVPRAQLRSVASVASGGFAMWVKVRNHRAYIADNRLQIYDVANPASPAKLGSYGTTTTRITAFDLTDDTAYCVDGSSLILVNISNPALPELRKNVTLNFTGLDVIIRNGLAYVGGTTSLAIYNVSDPANPILVSTFATGPIYTLAKEGDVLFLAAAGQRVQLLDVSNPASPTLLATLPEVSFADTVKIAGNRLYVAGNSFAIYDISVPSRPRLLGLPRAQTESSFTGANGMTADGAFMFHGTSIENEGLYLVDAANPSQPGRIGQLKLTGRIEGADWADNHLFLAHGWSWDIVEWGPATNAPVITLPLQNVLAVADSNLRLEAAASGAEPLTWQWFKDQAPMPNETNRTLKLPAIRSVDLALYSAVATSSAGQTSAGSLTIKLIAPSSFDLALRFGDSRGTKVSAALPQGLQATIQVSSNLLGWDSLWSGEARSEAIEIFDKAGIAARERFYRLKYGVE